MLLVLVSTGTQVPLKFGEAGSLGVPRPPNPQWYNTMGCWLRVSSPLFSSSGSVCQEGSLKRALLVGSIEPDEVPYPAPDR